MPTLSTIQSQLQHHERWLIVLRGDSCMTLSKIQRELEDQKHVEASLHQLETYFRNLGQRKNLSRTEWISVFRALDSQRAFGRTYDLYVSDKLITDENLRKKRKNARPAQPLVSSLAEADRLITDLPPGVTVTLRSPLLCVGTGSSTTPAPEVLTCPNTDLNGDDNLLFENILASNSTKTDQADLEAIQVGLESYSAGILGVHHDLDLVMPTPGVQANIAPGELQIDFGGSFLMPSHTEDYSMSLESGDQGNPGIIPSAGYSCNNITSITSTKRHLSLIESARLFVEDAGSLICRRERHASGSQEMLTTAEELLDNLQALVFLGIQGSGSDETENIIQWPRMLTDEFSQLFLFSTVNNFAGIDALPKKFITNFIENHEPTRAEITGHFAKGSSTIFAHALIENLLEAAVVACNPKVVYKLLALQAVNPNDIVCKETFGGHHHAYEKGQRLMTAIEKASRLRHFEIVELLLRFGADVNKTYELAGSQSERGALECAVGLCGGYRPMDHRLLDLLLNSGAVVSSRLFEAAVRWADARLIEKLISRLPPAKHKDFFSQVLVDAAEFLRNDTGYTLICQMILACRQTHNNECLRSKRGLFAQAMVKAARRNNGDLVSLLIPHTGQEGLDSALAAASRSGSNSLIQLLLAQGARGDGPACKVDAYDSFMTTPLAEAIRRGDDDLVGLFQRVGAWDHISEPGRLESALQAIAESGNLTYLHRVLEAVAEPKPTSLTSPLNSAIKAGNEEVALKLLEAGADVNWVEAKSPLVEALRAKSQTITWAILEHDVRVKPEDSRMPLDETPLEAATMWGDQDIVKALAFMGANVNAHRYEPPLSIAIKAGKRSLIELLINLGANISGFKDGCSSPLATAALVKDADTANYLLDHGADPADEQAFLNAHTNDQRILNLILQHFHRQHPKGRRGFGGRVLHHAIETHNDALLDLCLHAGFDPNSLINSKEHGNITALGIAIRKYHGGCLDLISKLLIVGGGDANVVTSERLVQCPKTASKRVFKRVTIQQTAILDAIETKSLPLVELLISKGADLEKEAKLGLKRTPLQKACEVASHSIVDHLLAHNADVNAGPAIRGGATALQLAAKAGSVRIAKRLLALGADVNEPGARVGGQSAIENAAEYGRLHMIPVLWNAAGANFAEGQHARAVTLAHENGHSACVALLRNLARGIHGPGDAGGMADDGIRASVILC